MENEKLTMKDDIMFKYFFSKKGNEKFLRNFLNVILENKYKIKEITFDSNFEQTLKEEKYGVLDLDLELENGKIINVQMHIGKKKNIEKKVAFYAAKRIVEQEDKLDKVIIITILKDGFIDTPEYVSRSVTRIKSAGGEQYVEIDDGVQYIYIELDKFRNQEVNMDEEINQWLSFIDMENSDRLDIAIEKNNEIKEAKMEYDNLPDRELERLENIRLFNSLEYGETFELGRQEGKRTANIDIAKKLLQKGLSKKEILELTDLTENEIDKLKGNTTV